MKALVTGGAGFIGSHLCKVLLSQGHEVVVLDDLSSGRATNISTMLGDPGCTFLEGSILDEGLLDRAATGCDAMFHLAAAVGVRLILDQPIESLRVNLDGTALALSVAARQNCSLVFASTSEVYGKQQVESLSEDDNRVLGSPLKSRWSYSEAKALGELLVYTHWQRTGLHSVIARLFNTVGPGQSGRYGTVLPRLTEQALSGQPLTVFGDGLQTRCFCYVGEVVAALVKLSQTPNASGRAVNLGGTQEISVLDLALKIRNAARTTSVIHHIPYTQAYGPGFEETLRRVPDITLARDLIGFEPKVGLDDIINLVLAERSGPPQSSG